MMVGRGVPSLRIRARARSIASTGRRSRQRCSPHATTFPSRSRAWEASSSPSTSPPSRSTLHDSPRSNFSKVDLIETVLTRKFLRPALPRLLHRRDPLGKPHRRVMLWLARPNLFGQTPSVSVGTTAVLHPLGLVVAGAVDRDGSVWLLLRPDVASLHVHSHGAIRRGPSIPAAGRPAALALHCSSDVWPAVHAPRFGTARLASLFAHLLPELTALGCTARSCGRRSWRWSASIVSHPHGGSLSLFQPPVHRDAGSVSCCYLSVYPEVSTVSCCLQSRSASRQSSSERSSTLWSSSLCVFLPRASTKLNRGCAVSSP